VGGDPAIEQPTGNGDAPRRDVRPIVRLVVGARTINRAVVDV
jgi:hypothetical protein